MEDLTQNLTAEQKEAFDKAVKIIEEALEEELMTIDELKKTFDDCDESYDFLIVPDNWTEITDEIKELFSEFEEADQDLLYDSLRNWFYDNY